MEISKFLQKSKRQRRALARRASRDKNFYKEYRKLTFDLKVEVNKRMRQLKKSNLDYGREFNKLRSYLTEIESNKLLSPNEMGNELNWMMEQNEVAMQFLKSGWSNVAKARESEQFRLNALKELDVLPTSFTRRKEVEFLRWLGNEEVTAVIDAYGRSDIIVDMAYDIYKDSGRSGLEALSLAMTEFLSNRRLGFDEAMERRGINIEKYSLKADKRRSRLF